MPKIKTGGGFRPEQWRVENSLLYKGIRRTCRNKLIVLFFIFIPLCVFLFYPLAVKYQLKYATPAVVGADELLAITDMKTKPRLPFSTIFENSAEYSNAPWLKRIAYMKNRTAMLSITGDGMISANIKPVENALPGILGASGGGKAYSEYVLLKISEKILLTKRAVGAQGLSCKGTLCYLPGDLLTIASESSGIDASQFIPAIFDASGEILASLRIDTLFCLIAFILWFIPFVIVMRRYLNPTLHDAYKAIYVYAGPVEDNIRDLDSEISGDGCISTHRQTITPNWIITNTLFRFMVKKKER